MVAPIEDPNRIPNFVAQLSAIQGQPRERQFQGVTLLEWPAQNIATEQKSLNPFSGLKQRKPPPGLPLLAQTRPVLPDTTPTPPVPSVPGPPRVPSPEAEGKSGLAIAIVPGYVAAAQSSAPLERWIATKDTGSSLARNPLFQRTLGHPEFGRSLVVGYGNLPELAPLWTGGAEPNRTAPLPASRGINPVQSEGSIPYNAIDLMVWMEPEGIRAQSRSFYKTPPPRNGGAIDPQPNGGKTSGIHLLHLWRQF